MWRWLDLCLAVTFYKFLIGNISQIAKDNSSQSGFTLKPDD